MSVTLALLAMIVELCASYPQALLRAIGHPVTWIGRLIAALDRLLNRETADPHWRRSAGIIAILLLLGIVGSIAFVVERELLRLPFGLIAVAVIASTLIAQRSLYQHVADVATALEQGGVIAGRAAVA
ncbi:MAG TPA: cobalamin biosynthesis protein, partial [Xanthobacteraceae bacterium]|nr:cobalamin biosynthesis protein [Xanthobacteraceae bacterium]